MKRLTNLLLSLICCLPLCAQIYLTGYNQTRINPALFKDMWTARWISVPGAEPNRYGVFHFRKTWQLDSVPGSYVIHVSADNRYKLYANGQLVSLGPARGDLSNWNFETVDLAPYLKPGKNVLAAVVWNYAGQRPLAQISNGQAELIVQGNTEKEQEINTDNSWKCLSNKAYSPCTDGQVMGYYVAGPGERVDMQTYPWEWEQPDYDDIAWLNAIEGIQGATKGSRDYSGRLLVPSSLPPMEHREERMSAVRECQGVECPPDFLQGTGPLTIPAHTETHLLLDNRTLTTGYLSILLSGGKGAEVSIGYAESLYEPTPDGSYTLHKGHRDQIEGKRFFGYEDKLLPDGGKERRYTSLWWRTWRYIELRIHTADESLTLEDIHATFTAYPFERCSSFHAKGHEELNRILDIGWLTARLCAHETYMDCPYYEQLQYLGDTRIQAMITLYNTRDTCLVKQAIEQGRRSLTPEGITASRYPSYARQLIPSYSLCWIGMGYDYWMYRGDETYIKTLLPAHRSILAWYEQWLKPDYSLDYIPYWFFADWAYGFPNGEPVREEHGNSAFQDLKYLLALEEAASMEQALGLPTLAGHYRDIAGKIRSTIRTKYWDENKQLFADTHDHRNFSQHVNTLAILAGIVTGSEARALMERTLTDKSLTQATIYFRYYVQQAMDKAQAGDLLTEHLDVWRDLMALGLTTWAEEPEPSRSDCHAWGSSLNVEFFRILLGIRSDSPGFKHVLITPSFGSLTNISGSIPHPLGEISVSYQIKKKLKADITLPPGVSGTFVWKGKKTFLHPGRQLLELSNQ